MDIDREKKSIAFLDRHHVRAFDIQADSIKDALYERTAKPRYAAGLFVAWPLLLTKAKQHYLTLQYQDSNGVGQFAIVRLDKRNYKEVLAAVEAATGKKVERTEER